MSKWLSVVLTRIRELAMKRKVRFTLKALRELAGLEFGIDVEDAVEVLVGLKDSDSAGRLISRQTGEWLYVFKPHVGGKIIYLKLALRGDCVLISFHEDQEDESDKE
jgi:hypothetical protein